MRKVKIITDSCADIPGALLDRYDLDYARMNTVYDGKQTAASLRWEYYSPHELYELMRQGKRVTTTQVPAEEFHRIFRLYLEQGMDIVYIACSVKQSGSINTAGVVAKEMEKEFPDATICCIDSFNASDGEGMLAIRAAELRDQGLGAQEIANEIIAIRKTVNEYITVHTLDALRRAGRVKGTAAFFGNLLGVKPIIISDADGVQTPIKKVKGRQNSITEIVNLLKESIVEPEKQTVYVVHADCPEEAEALKQRILAEISCRDVFVNYIGPIVGASIGPDAIGVFAFGKPVTYRIG